jgi:hypothetical protein
MINRALLPFFVLLLAMLLIPLPELLSGSTRATDKAAWFDKCCASEEREDIWRCEYLQVLASVSAHEVNQRLRVYVCLYMSLLALLVVFNWLLHLGTLVKQNSLSLGRAGDCE